MTSTSVRSWFGERTTPVETGFHPGRMAEMILEDMRGIPMGGYPVTTAPIVVPNASYTELLEATGRLVDLHRHAVLSLAPDLRGRISALKLDPEKYPRVIGDDAFESRHCADVARADVVVGESGPMFVEFNFGAGIGGMVQFETMRRAWARVWSEAGSPALLGTDPFEQFAGVVARTGAELGISPSALLIGSLDDSSVSGRYLETQIRYLLDHGVAARFIDLADLPHAREEFADLVGVVQYCETEAEAEGWDMSGVTTAMRAGLRTIPTQTTRLLDSKKVLAMLSEGLPWMSADDHAFVRRFVPWTRVLGDRPVDWNGRTHHLPTLLADRQESFVLKGADGYSSQDVFFGAQTDPSAWRDLISRAVESEYYVAQEVVATVRHPAQVIADESGEVTTVSANSVISPFAVDGVATGCLVRFDTATEPGAITVRSGARLACLLGEPA